MHSLCCRTATALTGSTPAPPTLSSPRWEPIATLTSRVNAPHAPSPAATCAPGRRPVPRSCSCCAKRSRIVSSWRNWSVTVVPTGTMAASQAITISHISLTSNTGGQSSPVVRQRSLYHSWLIQDRFSKCVGWTAPNDYDTFCWCRRTLWQKHKQYDRMYLEKYTGTVLCILRDSDLGFAVIYSCWPCFFKML